jgi:hypothetical protein
MALGGRMTALLIPPDVKPYRLVNLILTHA